MTNTAKLATLAIAGLAALPLAACSSSPSSAPAAATQAAARTPAPAATLAPLTLGHFPATTDGRLAKGICRSWSGVRQEYALKLSDDTSFALQRWMSGTEWTKINDNAMKLGADPRYGKLEVALGIAMTASDTSIAVARQVDRACSKAD